MKKQKIIITGMNGLLGSILEKTLKEDHDVAGIFVDIRDSVVVKDFGARQGQADWIIHTAAITDVDLCERDHRQCYDVNFEGTKNIRDLAKLVGAKLIYISTASVFSGIEGNYKETDVPYPNNFYNLSKLLGESCVSEYDKGLIIRLNLIGIHLQGSRGKNFFEWLVDSVIKNNDIRLFSDVMINPLSNFTIAELINKVIRIEPKEKILHISSKNILSKADIGKIVIDRLGYNGKAVYSSIEDGNSQIKRPKQMWLNSDYAQTKIGLEMPTLEAEVEKILRINKLVK